MATKPEDQAGVKSNTDKDLESLIDSFVSVSLSEVIVDKDPGAVEQKGISVTMPPPASPAEGVGGANKQEKHGHNRGKDTGTSSSGEKHQDTDQQKTPKARKLPPTPSYTSEMQQPKLKGPEKDVLMKGKDSIDAKGSPECLQESMKRIKVLVKVQGKSSSPYCTVKLTDSLRYKFLEKDREYTERISEMFKQELNIELSFNCSNILVLTFAETSEQSENIDLVVKEIFERMDEVEINKVPLGGLDPVVLDDKMGLELEEQGVKFFSEYDEETERFVYIYLKKDVKKVDKVIQSVMKTTSEEHGAKDAKVMTKKEESPYLNVDKNACTADFCIVYKNIFDSEKVKEELSSHGIQLESSDITVDEENNLIHLILGRNWKGDKEKDMQRIRDITKDYPANTVSYQDIKWSEKESTTHLSAFLEIIFSDMSKEFLEGKSLLWYVNEKARKVSVCTSSQPETDEITNKLKSCLLLNEIDVNDCQNIENVNDFLKELNEYFQGRCICSKKDSKISIWGLKYAVEEAEQKLHGISQQKKASRIQQHGSPEVSRHENGSPVSVTKENDAPEQEQPKNEMNPPGTGLSDNGTSGTTTMEENNATTESDAQGNNAPQGDNLNNDKNDDATTESNAQGNNAPKDGNLNNDKNNDDTTESDSLGNGTPKTEFMYEGAFKPKSKNALKLLMKQGALDELKRKYKFDLDINRYGVILKVPDMVLSGAVKDELTKIEESFEFVKKTISLPCMQKDELEVVISQCDVDTDVVVFQDESGVPGPPEKRSCRGKRWIHSQGHKIVLMNDQVEHHWEELMIEILVGDGKPDGPKKCEDGRWKVTLCIPKAKDIKDLHHLSDIFKMMLNNVQEHYSICMSLEPIGNFQVNKYAKKMLHTVQIWLEKRGEPVSLYLCAPESYETIIRCFNLLSGTYSEAEDITVETMPSSVSLTLMGSRDSDFQQAEEKIRKLAEEIKLKSQEKKRMQKEDERNNKTCDEETRKDETVKTKARDIAVTMETIKEQYQAEQNSQGNKRNQTPTGAAKEDERKDRDEDQFTPETYLIITKPVPVGKIKTELDKLCKSIKIIDGPRIQGILLICQNEEDAIKLIRKKKKTFEVQQLKKTGLKWKTMRIREVPLSDDIKRELKEAQVRVFGKNKDILRAPTLHQIDFAMRLIESAVKTTVKPKEFKKPGKKSDSVKATAKLKEVTETVKKSDTVEIQGVPALVYELLKIKEKLGELNQKGEKIEYSNGSLRCPSAVQKLSEKLKKMELDEIVLQGEEEKMDVKTFCDEINKNVKKELCVYDSVCKKVILYADAYDDMQKVKHQLNVKLERIKVTGRRGRRQMKTLEDTSLQIKIDFVWNRDAKNKEVFRTKEGMHVYVYEASIIKLPVDCIVNAANDTMMHGGGIARVIARAAGRTLDTECRDILKKTGNVQVGANIVTTAGELPYRCVIHAVGPRWSDYYPHTLSKVNECEQDLYDAIFGSLTAAESKGLKTIALPAISSAIFGVPERLCVYQYAKATLDYSKKSAGKDSCLTEVHFIDINADIVKKIQAMFITMVRDDKDPGYDSQEFVAGQSSWDSCSTDHGHSGQCNCQQPQHQSNPDVPKGVDKHRFQGNLHVHNEDLFLLKIRHKNAVVMFVDDKLQPQGPVAGKLVVSLIKWKDTDNYRKERDEKRRNYGNMFVTNGYGCGFDNIIHVVGQGFQNTKNFKERKTQVMEVYGNILDFALRVRPIAAVVLTLIRIGDGADDMKHSAEAFKESFDKKMVDIADRNIAVHVVCNDSDKAHVVLNALDMKPTVQQESVYPSTSTSDTDMTWCNYNIKQGASATMMDNRMSGDDIDLIKDKDSSGSDKDRGATGSQDRGHGDGEERIDKEELNCVICMDKMDDDSTILRCGHSFCTGCINQHFKNKQACPTCGMVCGIITGDQPDGTMSIDANSHQHCAGYPGHGLIEITYCFLNGQQGPRHPSPGTWYKGITRTAYLPDNKDGREICEMLKVAFHRRLVFTIGRSTTTGQEGVINWNDIHHKTDPNPNGLFGYPDKTFLNRVRKELAAKGITPKDIPSTSSSH